MQDDLESASARKAWAEGKQTETQGNLDDELAKPASDRCAPCIASLNQELANYEILIAQLESEISRLRSEIKERVKLYNVELEERAKFGQQVQSMNEAWGQFNNSLDELQRALSKDQLTLCPLKGQMRQSKRSRNFKSGLPTELSIGSRRNHAHK